MTTKSSIMTLTQEELSTIRGLMSVRSYLEEKAETPREWLRRTPRETHPVILALVREFEAGGGFYNDDAERFVAERVGNLPEHRHHGHDERDPLTSQLGHEVYIAKACLTDERARASLEEAQGDGFEPLDAIELEEDGRYIIRTGTLYGGQDVPVYGEPREVRARKHHTGRFYFLPKGARTRGFVPSGPALVKHV